MRYACAAHAASETAAKTNLPEGTGYVCDDLTCKELAVIEIEQPRVYTDFLFITTGWPGAWGIGSTIMAARSNARRNASTKMMRKWKVYRITPGTWLDDMASAHYPHKDMPPDLIDERK